MHYPEQDLGLTVILGDFFTTSESKFFSRPLIKQKNYIIKNLVVQTEAKKSDIIRYEYVIKICIFVVKINMQSKVKPLTIFASKYEVFVSYISF